MSLDAHLNGLQKAGSLVHYSTSLWPDETCLRRLWLHPNVNKWAQNAGGDPAEAKYAASVRAVFSAFVRLEDFDDDAMFKPIIKGPNGKMGMWEIKITFFPAARVLGGFLRKGEFVALSYGDRGLLASAGFEPLIKVVKRRWEDLFPQSAMLKGSRQRLLERFDA